MAVHCVGLVVNTSKREALDYARQVIAWLDGRGVSVRVDERGAAALCRNDLAADSSLMVATDLIITLGGDGTILAASHMAAPAGIPILGVHMGRFGFIAETDPEDLPNHLDHILAGNVAVQERTMVRGTVIRGTERIHSAAGLNDIVISKGARARMLHFQIAFGDETVATYPADGVVVSTPTGSTAYALSAGGPLLEPTVQALLVVPICPHTLAARSLVVPPEEVLRFQIESDEGEVLFIADSDRVVPLHTGDQVEISRAEFSARIVTLHRATFYRKIRDRLLWGGRISG